LLGRLFAAEFQVVIQPAGNVMWNQTGDDEYHRAAAKYSVSYMSDTKWRKLFLAVHRAGVGIERAIWRFIDSDRPFEMGLPREDELDATMIRDGRFQPTEYKWIESIFVPSEYRPRADVGYTKRQDVDGLVKVLQSVADFMLEKRLDGVAILGYGGRVDDAG
jgi:hypothetical protein